VPFATLGSIADTVKCLASYNGSLYAGGTFANLLSKLNGAAWLNINTNAIINGQTVNALKVYEGNLFIGGDFSIDSTINAARLNAQDSITSCGGNMTPINCFEVCNNILFAGCTYQQDSNRCWVAQYKLGNNWKKYASYPLVNPIPMSGKKINSLVKDGNMMYCLGDFTSGDNKFSQGTCKIPLDSSGIISANYFITLNGSGNCGIVAQQGFIGLGNFTKSLQWNSSLHTTLNNLFHHSLTPTAITQTNKNSSINIIPNPATNYMTVNGLERDKNYTIYDAQGKIIHTAKYNGKIDLHAFTKGTYYLQAAGNSTQFIIQ
jgi:Secretion system C-terminal sorting domain